jgi:hypothetical protein
LDFQLKFTSVEVADQQGQICEDGIIGEIRVKGRVMLVILKDLGKLLKG